VPLGTITTSKRGEHAVATQVAVRTAHGDVDANGKRRGRGDHSAESLLPTICGSSTDFAIATPYLVHRSNGERGATETTKAQEPRVYDAQKPLGTIVAQGQKHALSMPVLVKNYSEREGGFAGGQRMNAPIGTITQRDHHSIAMLNLLKLRGTSDSHVNASASAVDEPLDTISASGTHFAMTAAYLIRYNGMSGPESLGEPISTIDTRDRFALVTLTMEREVSERALRVARFLGYDAPIVLEIDGVQWILVDIGFRMLTARELFLCQGFPPEYRIDLVFRGKPLTKTAQIKCVGNSVPPQLARAVGMAAIRTIEYTRAAA
jgi:DNA (cytosine-5)-methyltransferase 1